jgi:hypothetical protein
MKDLVDQIANLSPDIADFRAAQAARGSNTAPIEKNPDQLAIEAVNDRLNGHNAWSAGFPSSLHYPNGITQADVEALSHDHLLRLQTILARNGTIEVTTEILGEAAQLPDQTTQLSLPLSD